MLVTSSAARVRFVSVGRSGGGRRIAILEPQTLATYTRRVAEIAGTLEAALSHRVVANRVAACVVEPPELRLRPWRTERNAFASRLSELAERGGALAFADVRRCYASISPALVGSELQRLGVATAGQIEAFLRGLEPEGVRGLPVGPDPSAVLANAVLGHVDRALEHEGIAHVRWVDDVVLASSDPQRALRVLGRALDEIGLRLNERKTRVVLDATPSLRGLRLGSPIRGAAAPARR